ncbi:cytidylyltransferase domain-containing protein [Gorillibacterium massiliense]|uniref:cytidylyltransferase domain-containing protein n=1 Tax=Gorillibacterium massiliense TaxID=1280390 RepID=UPI0004B0ED98|nr:glycosyltransferase family protein [Gorillibacterium massiliense]
MKVVAIIQARMGSTRLPGKVLKDLFGKSVLNHVIDRVQNVKEIDQVVVATTVLESDDPIVAEACKAGAGVYRGEEQDVLSRYYGAALDEKADLVVRITSDCPLVDSKVVSEIITFHKQHNFDYVSNTLSRTFPRGLDVEIFTFEALQKAYEEGNHPEEREHVTPYIYHNPSLFSLYDYKHSEDLSNYRWTLDTLEDWKLIQSIYEHLYTPHQYFGLAETLELIRKKPELSQINAHVEQKKLSYVKGIMGKIE